MGRTLILYPDLPVLTPGELISSLKNKDVAEAAELEDDLESSLREYLADGYLVILMTAGPVDEWLREKFGSKN